MASVTPTNIYWMSADGSGSPERLQTASGRWWPMAFEPGGRHLVYHGLPKPGAKAEIGHLDIGGDRTSRQLLSSTFHNYDPSLSPDGRWMAYISDESGRFEVYVQALSRARWTVAGVAGRGRGAEMVGDRPRDLLSERRADDVSGGAHPAHLRSRGRTQLFTGAYVQLSSLVTNYDVTRDGQTFLMLQSVQGTEQSLDVTLNWFDRLRAGSRRE